MFPPVPFAIVRDCGTMTAGMDTTKSSRGASINPKGDTGLRCLAHVLRAYCTFHSIPLTARQDEFGVSLEESLIRAMASDHEDYDIAGSYNAIRNQLLPLAEIAAAEEATGFDPSGLSSAPDAVGLGLDDTTTDDTNPVSQSSATELTASNSDSSDNPEALRFTDEADLPEDEKIDNLMMIFSNFKAHTIKFVLKQAGGDLERAFDELLNRQFLDENGELARGVEGFYYLPNKETARRKGQGRETSHSPYCFPRLHCAHLVLRS